MAATWFTADTHFGHRAVIKYGERPFANVDEMDEALVAAWNGCVQPNDTVYHLGDFSFRKTGETTGLLCRLNGIKYLVNGNHDRVKSDHHLFWQWVKDYVEIKIGGQKVVLCHYPLETWNKAHHGAWHLHGHSHGNLQTRRGGRMDVGIDTHRELRPYSWDEIEEALRHQHYTPVDHHTPRSRS